MSATMRPHARGMSACVLAAFAVVLLSAPVANAQFPEASDFEWRISSSSTDAEVETGPPFVGEQDLYLWLTCSVRTVSTARMDLTGSFELVSFTPEPGVTVVAPIPSLDVDIGCQGGPWILVGTLRVRDAAGSGGEVCMGPDRRTFACEGSYDDRHAFIGYTTLGPFACGGNFCGIDYVDPTSWGRVKAYFESGG